jgi:outer membrane receptor protein involved in Fe transport
VQLAQGSTSNRQIIRGIGSGDNPSFEQSVGTFVDDVYHGRSRTSEADLFDLDRVEILKGPQTTYFGNNAIAGALSELTHDPGNTFGGYMRGAYTPQFNGYTYEAAVDLPASNQLTARIAGQFARSDGWIDDLGAGQHIPNTQNAGIRGTLVWNPTEARSVFPLRAAMVTTARPVFPTPQTSDAVPCAHSSKSRWKERGRRYIDPKSVSLPHASTRSSVVSDVYGSSQ